MANGPVLVVDFGAQYAQLIARRVREANVYSELVPHSMPVDEMLAKDPQAIILSGGPASVFEPVAIAREELSRAGLDRDIWQCPVVLLADVHSVGVQGDERTYGSPIVLRPVSSEDAMTADWSRVPYDVLATISTRITNECRQINRVVLDCTSKPPATIEWE